jgi:hypothetical protein
VIVSRLRSNLYRDTRNAYKNLYLDTKNRAKPSLHRDIFLAKVTGSWSDASSGNVYYHNRRAVSLNSWLCAQISIPWLPAHN